MRTQLRIHRACVPPQAFPPLLDGEERGHSGGDTFEAFLADPVPLYTKVSKVYSGMNKMDRMNKKVSDAITHFQSGPPVGA